MQPTPPSGIRRCCCCCCNSQGLAINSSGSTKFFLLLTLEPLSLKQLLHVPAITKNLISVSKFTKDNNVFFEFYPNHCAVKSQGTNKVLLQGSLDPDGLYVFPHLVLRFYFRQPAYFQIPVLILLLILFLVVLMHKFLIPL